MYKKGRKSHNSVDIAHLKCTASFQPLTANFIKHLSMNLSIQCTEKTYAQGHICWMIKIAAPLDNLSQKLIEPKTNAPESCIADLLLLHYSYT